MNGFEVTTNLESSVEDDMYKAISPGIIFCEEMGDYIVEVNGSTLCTFFGPHAEDAAKLFVKAIGDNNKNESHANDVSTSRGDLNEQCCDKANCCG